ncbi:carbohydrate porin [Lichenicoccus roseus]|uniref:Carbohydrate porin n=1 Tax=Lichenicoccus roseus TaxID=2683649 RepID=A0A5R9JER4_9PROT|nr:carbohydrate porin [Lichenicoccus roseus]TLU74121.1 carbohydrate porin [Lichenicoccus roseus]
MGNSKSILLALAVAIVAGAVAMPARADDPSLSASSPATSPPGAPPLGAQQLGPQLHAQSQVALASTSPVTIRLEYTGEEAYNAAGGLKEGNAYMNQALVQVAVDAGSAFGWSGGRFDFEGFYENATSLDTQYVGAIQDPSVIDTSGSAVFRLYQAFYAQQIGRTNVLLGVYDVATEFDETKASDLFFNGAYGWTTTFDQSGLNGPSTYPSTSLALRIQQKVGRRWRLKLAVVDGEPDSARNQHATSVNINKTNGALVIGEVDYIASRTTKLMAGGWGYTGRFPLIEASAAANPRQVYGSDGGFVGGTTRLWSLSAHRGLDAFANLGIANGRVQIVDGSVDAGLNFSGPFAGRPFDKLGAAVGVARAGDPYRSLQVADGNGVERYETNFELTYRAPINDWLTVQPDIQYWINPSVDPGLKNDLLFMVHFEVSHLFDL